jgi:murein hydrolase activator
MYSYSIKISLIIVLFCIFQYPDNTYCLAQKNPKKKNIPKSSIKKNNSVEVNKKELENLNKSINQTKSRIQKLNKKEKNTLEKIRTYQQRSNQTKKNINKLTFEIKALYDSLKSINMEYTIQNSRLNYIRELYAYLVRQAYLDNTSAKINTVFTKSSKQRNDLYMRYFSKSTDNLALNLSNTKDSLQGLSSLLKEKSDKHNELKKEKENENIKLKSNIKHNEGNLNQIRTDKKLQEQELAAKKKSARELKSIITRLIQEENKRKTKISQKSVSPNNKNKTPENLSVNPSGKYSWPASSRTLLRKYGPYKNPETGTILDNPGIDISAKKGTNVKASSPGFVSLVHWLPGYGSLIIIDHGDDMRTVYANLSEVSVRQGNKVQNGTVIGRTGESVDGEFLHFEVWRGTRRLNPLNYLR